MSRSFEEQGGDDIGECCYSISDRDMLHVDFIVGAISRAYLIASSHKETVGIVGTTNTCLISG